MSVGHEPRHRTQAKHTHTRIIFSASLTHTHTVLQLLTTQPVTVNRIGSCLPDKDTAAPSTGDGNVGLWVSGTLMNCQPDNYRILHCDKHFSSGVTRATVPDCSHRYSCSSNSRHSVALVSDDCGRKSSTIVVNLHIAPFKKLSFVYKLQN